MNAGNTTVIFGPPGTGKTTQLLEVVNDCLAGGMDPTRICFLAFTRKAANEAATRAKAKFPDTDFPLFRTIHSLAFKQLGLQRGEMMGISDYISIAKSLGLYITAKGIQEDGTIIGLSKGDRLLFMESMARARMMDLRDYWSNYPNEDIDYWELKQLADTIGEYKQGNAKHDFIDILYTFLATGRVPGHDQLIVDEAQDLSPLQWAVIDKIGKDSPNVVVAGDDDQAIFTWAGADVDTFINMPGSRRVLAKSYRVPSEIQLVANRIVSQIDIRVHKAWEPRAVAGAVEYITDLAQIDMSQGTWLLLGRNVFLLEQYNNHCLASGLIFTSTLGSPIQDGSLRAIVTWENLRKGLAQPVGSILKCYELMTSKVGVAYGFKTQLENEPEHHLITLDKLKSSFGLLVNSIWHEALDKIPAQEREYFIAALRRGEKLLKEPRIRVSTIHSVKGGEADNVVICSDMAPRSYAEMESDPDSEHRVWYVAVTRARERLIIIQPKTNYHYKI